jgi:hypothetical protein
VSVPEGQAHQSSKYEDAAEAYNHCGRTTSFAQPLVERKTCKDE